LRTLLASKPVAGPGSSAAAALDSDTDTDSDSDTDSDADAGTAAPRAAAGVASPLAKLMLTPGPDWFTDWPTLATVPATASAPSEVTKLYSPI
jgi:hypothetical protein